MARVVVAESARADLAALVLSHGLPASTRARVRTSLRPLATFPLLGPALIGWWQGFRFILGPWPWMLLVYVYDAAADQVSVITIQDSRSARAATSGHASFKAALGSMSNVGADEDFELERDLPSIPAPAVG